MTTLFQLFLSFLQVGLFSVGGGYAALPIIQQQSVEAHGWLTMAEFADVLTISEMTPGPIALNAATFVGTQVAGIAGALIATLGCIAPSLVIVLTLAWAYGKYRQLPAIQGALSALRPAVVGLIAAAGLSIVALAMWGGSLSSFAWANIDIPSVLLFAVALAALRKWKPNPILIMLGCGAAGFLIGLF